MSTTFGIFKKEHLLEDCGINPTKCFLDDDFIEVAFRSSHGIRWKNELAPYLSNDIKVYPLNNTAQGIYTIGDIKKEINQNNMNDLYLMWEDYCLINDVPK